MANKIIFERIEFVTVRQEYTTELDQVELEGFIKHYHIKDLTVEELLNIIDERNEDIQKLMSFNGTDFKDGYVYEIFYEYMLDIALSYGPADEEYVDYQDSDESITVIRGDKEKE
jgi:hypothetical protein